MSWTQGYPGYLRVFKYVPCIEICSTETKLSPIEYFSIDHFIDSKCPLDFKEGCFFMNPELSSEICLKNSKRL